MANDAIGSVGIVVRGVRYDGIKVTRLGVNEIELLGFKDSVFLRLGSFGCNILSNDRKEGFKEPI